MLQPSARNSARRTASGAAARGGPLRRLRRQLVLVLGVYFFAGSASQKLIPGVDEIVPFFGWSLFSKVPDRQSTYSLVIHRHGRRRVRPPADFLTAPESMVTGNRYIARKVVQSLGRALDRGETAEAERLRGLLEEHYLRGRVRYELRFERYDPLEIWRGGQAEESRSLGRFDSGVRDAR